MRWQVQEAKQRFSEVVRAAEAGEPQIVTRHGEEVAVIIDMSEYRHLRGSSQSFMDYLRVEPVDDGLEDGLDTQRAHDLPRDVDLVG